MRDLARDGAGEYSDDEIALPHEPAALQRLTLGPGECPVGGDEVLDPWVRRILVGVAILSVVLTVVIAATH